MKVSVIIEQAALAHAYNALKHIPGAFPRAVAAASNRALETVRTEAVRETSKRYFVKAGEVRKTFKPKKASANNLYGAMISRGKRKNISKYQITPKTQQAGRKQGFRGAVKQEGGLKPLPKGTFMLNTPNAGPVLFLRVASGNSWANITHVFSPSIPQIVKNDETVEVVEKRAQEVFIKRLDHEVMRLLGAMP